MKIDLGGGYALQSDTYNCWITKEVPTKDENAKNKTMTVRVSGYYAHPREAMESFVWQKIRGSNVETIKELALLVDKIDAIIEKL